MEGSIVEKCSAVYCTVLYLIACMYGYRILMRYVCAQLSFISFLCPYLCLYLSLYLHLFLYMPVSVSLYMRRHIFNNCLYVHTDGCMCVFADAYA